MVAAAAAAAAAEENATKCRTPEVVGLQPVALVDYVARVDWSLLHSVPGERGGSIRVTASELDEILGEVNAHVEPSLVRKLAGGSVANTVRGLSVGFGVRCSIVGARGDDEQGKMFHDSMTNSRIHLSRLRVKTGPTGQCICLVDSEGNRTMRPCLSDAVRLRASELSREDFKGVKWVVLNGYGLYGEELVETAVSLAKAEGAMVSMDLASFEVVRNFRAPLMKLLQSKSIDVCFANEDEARELMSDSGNKDPESALSFLTKYCRYAVVMLGSKGCIGGDGEEVIRVEAVVSGGGGGGVVDTTGAGGAVVRNLGGEVNEEGWKWMYDNINSLNLPSTLSK